ncbi:MAG: Flp pilus assembly complex ATPase component TadA [Candidatus Aureabacteria bacterium]|nr:Flp pilus assembly complex ATPase component TadA [Candidatus Auribacterota bacterium]
MNYIENQEVIKNILIETGVIQEKDLEEAQEYIRKNNANLITAFVKLGKTTDKEITQNVAEYFGYQTADLSTVKISHSVITQIDEKIAKKYKIMPISQEDGVLTIAFSDPLDINLIDNLRLLLKKDIEGVVASEGSILNAIKTYYDQSAELTDENGFVSSEDQEGNVEFLDEGTERASSDDAPVIKLVSLMISDAFRMRASDIHLEPLEKNFRVRYRIDGVLHEMQSPSKDLQSAVLQRVKLMANMSLAEKRLPQDGKIKIKIINKDIDIRVSSLPSTHGESIVMRILDKSNLLVGLSQLGFAGDIEKKWNELINLPNGVLLITGPTGSGKTTTLYGCLNFLNKPETKIITVEDPIEYQLTGINQVQVREDIGLVFSSILRTCLRQAPNIIMVGEIRDLETAKICMNAAFTGHLVFSTLHTNDAPSAVTRLIDQGIKPFLVASAIRAILAQRLVRKICVECKESYDPTNEEIRLLDLKKNDISGKKFFYGKGCPKCQNTGYKGRIAIAELIIVDEHIQELIYRNASSMEIKKLAVERGMRVLKKDAVLKVFSGETTAEEVIRVTKSDI